MNRARPCLLLLSVSLTLGTPAATSAQQVLAPERIAFTRVREDETKKGDYRVEAEIWMMNSDGSDPRRLTRNTSDDFGIAWSPDGRTLVFGAVQFEPDSTGELKPVSARIYSMSAEGGPPTAITPADMRAQFPSWSSDGRRIVFHGGTSFQNNAGMEIYVMRSDGTEIRKLTSNNVADIRPDWSPDGRRIAYTSNRSGSSQIHVMNADGSNDVQITTGPAGVHNRAPDWSPSGDKIVFVSSRDGKAQIYVMNADGTGQTRLSNGVEDEGDPEWSADGKHIAFDRDVAFEKKKVPQLYIMNADGSNPVPLTKLPSTSSHAAWSPRQRR
jgi:Tol biopolymer transport system component